MGTEEAVDPPLARTFQGVCPSGTDVGVGIVPDTYSTELAVGITSINDGGGAPPVGSYVGLVPQSPTNTTIGRGLVTRNAASTEDITVDFGFIGSSHSLVEVYNGTTLVSEANNRTGILANIPVFPWRMTSGLRGGAPTMSFSLQAPGTVTIPGMGSVTGDRVVVIAEGGSAVTTYGSAQYHQKDLDNATICAIVPPRFLTKWGSQGTGDGQFAFPISLAIDPQGNIYTVDFTNNRVQKFDRNGVFITKWGATGSGNGQFNQPADIGIDASGNVYVVDMGNSRIQKFSSNGTYITKWGAAGSGNGQFSSPTGLAVDTDGTVYVADTGNQRIQKFDGAGTYLTKWGTSGAGDGQFNQPVDVAVDTDGNIDVVDGSNYRIQQFTNSGAFLRKWGSQGTGVGQFLSPFRLAIGPDGSVSVADRVRNVVQRFSGYGKPIDLWGSVGSGDGQFSQALGIVSDGNRDGWYVSEGGNFRVQRFGQPVHNRSILPGEVHINPAGGGNYTISFEPVAGHTYSGSLDLGMTVTVKVDGTTIGTSTLSANLGPSDVRACSSWPNPGCTPITCAGRCMGLGSGDCVCGSRVSGVLPGSYFLHNNQIVTVSLAGKPGTIPEDYTEDDAVQIVMNIPADVQNGSVRPDPLSLVAMPTVSGGRTTFRYHLPAPMTISLDLFDVSGRLVLSLDGGAKSAGTYESVWSGRDAQDRPVADGIYWAWLRAGSQSLRSATVVLR